MHWFLADHEVLSDYGLEAPGEGLEEDGGLDGDDVADGAEARAPALLARLVRRLHPYQRLLRSQGHTAVQCVPLYTLHKTHCTPLRPLRC